MNSSVRYSLSQQSFYVHVLVIKQEANPRFAISQASDSDSISVSKTPLEANFSPLLDGRRNWHAKILSEN